MKLQTVSGAASTPAPRTRLNHGSSTRGSAVRMDSPLPLRAPTVFSTKGQTHGLAATTASASRNCDRFHHQSFLSLNLHLRRGIGGSVLDRSANATRDFSERSGAFRPDHSCPAALPTSRTGEATRVVWSERLSTLPGDVPSDAPSRGALPFPIHGQRKAVYSETLQGVVQKSEIAAGRAIGPSRRPVTNRTARTAHTAAEPHSRTLTGV